MQKVSLGAMSLMFVGHSVGFAQDKPLCTTPEECGEVVNNCLEHGDCGPKAPPDVPARPTGNSCCDSFREAFEDA
jgi:hypothetical protein